MFCITKGSAVIYLEKITIYVYAHAFKPGLKTNLSLVFRITEFPLMVNFLPKL